MSDTCKLVNGILVYCAVFDIIPEEKCIHFQGLQLARDFGHGNLSMSQRAKIGTSKLTNQKILFMRFFTLLKFMSQEKRTTKKFIILVAIVVN